MLLRSYLILLVSLVLWGILVLRLFDIQIVNYENYQSKVLSNVQKTTTTKATRGVIYDSSMNKLAANYTVYRIFISPHDIAEDQEKDIAKGLSEITGVEYSKILETTKKKVRWDETIVKKADEEMAEAVQNFKNEKGYTTQIYLEANQTRYYPYGSFASHVIGVVGTDGGLTGLEYQYDDFLTGESGKTVISKDATGAQIYSEYDSYVDASNGANIVSTINKDIQLALEAQVKAAYESSNPLNRAAGIVMDCNTGAVLGMAVYPTFDLNSPFELDEDSMRLLEESTIDPLSDEYRAMQSDLLYKLWSNKCVSELYEPGSTFKLITTAMALETGAVSFDDEFECTGLYHNTHCHKKRGHGVMPFRIGLQQSCNPTLMQVAELVGAESFLKFFEAFGYRELSGIDLPGESYSITHSDSGFVLGNLDAYSFGQSFKVAPIRHLTSICAVANGGYLVQPYIVDRIVDNDGKILVQHDNTPIRQVVSTEVCKQIWDVLEEGTSGDGQAKNAYVAGYKICAKTGTSEKLDKIGGEEDISYVVASTIAFAPSDNPQVAALILVDEPTCKSVYGGVVAAPYISNLMAEILPIVGIDRNYSDTDLAKVTHAMRGYVGWDVAEAARVLRNYGIDYEIIGTGTAVRFQTPAKGTVVIKKEAKVYLYTGTETPQANIDVPNVVGKTVSAANRQLKNLGFNVVVNGAVNTSSSTEAVVQSQSIEAHSFASKGQVVTITAVYEDTTA